MDNVDNLVYNRKCAETGCFERWKKSVENHVDNVDKVDSTKKEHIFCANCQVDDNNRIYVTFCLFM